MDRWGVRLDVCKNCQGVWLGAGELEQIIGFVRASLATANPQGMMPNAIRHHQDHDDDDYDRDHDHGHNEQRVEYDQNGKPHRKRRLEIGDIFG